MAEERKTFKWGDQEYLLDDLLKLHAAQENNYYDFAKTRGQYDDNALQGLRQAITNRINAVKSGEAFEGDGVLSTDIADNTRIQTQKKGLFRKEKYVDQDNTEWAKYYLNKLVSTLKPQEKQETPDKGAWDISKHGLSAYLTGQGLNAQEIFEKNDLRDENNPDNPRAYTQRHALLRKHLTGYRDWLTSKGFDFTKNDNEWDDNFLSDLNNLVNSEQFDNNTLAASLRKLGAGDGFTTAFTSDKWDLSKTNAQSEADIQKTKEEQENKLKNERLKTAQDEFLNNFVNDKGNYYTPLDYSSYKFRDGVTKSFMNYYSDLNPQQQQNHGTYLGTDNQVWANAWDKLMDSLKTGVEYSDKNKGILLQRYFEDAPNGFTDLGNGTYLINESINDKGTGYVYDPKSGFLQRRHISEFANQNDSIKKAYEDILYRHINNKYGTNYNNREYIAFENGGIIKAQLGAAVLKPYNVNTQYKEEANVKGISEKTQKAKNQYIDSDNKSEASPNAGLTTGQKARIGYAIADLGSAVAAFAPGAGTAVSAGLGLTSTIGNFISDIGDDAVTTGEMWRNLGLNLGMDALGLIPGGGAASKMGKIVRGLKTVVPALIALPGVGSMLANSPEIAESWKKAFDGDPENGGSKMSYQDYLNILQVLNVAAGGTNIARNVRKSSKASTKQMDKIAIDVTDKATNTRKALMLEGDDVAKFKEAQAQGKAQEFLDKIEGGNNYTINETTRFNRGKFWGKGTDDKFHLFNQNPLGSTNTGKANIFQVKQDAKTGKLYADTGWKGGDDLLDSNLINMSGRATEAAFVAKKQRQLGMYKDRLVEKAKAFGEAKAKNDQQITTVDSATRRAKKIGDQYDAQEASARETINTGNQLITELTDIANQQRTLQTLRTDYLRTRSSKTASKGEIRRKAQAVKAQEKLVNEQQLRIDDLRARINTDPNNRIHTIADVNNLVTQATNTTQQLAVQRNKLQQMLTRLGTQKTNLQSNYTTHSAEYNKSLNMQPTEVTFNGKKIKITPEGSFTEADLLQQGLCKQGGSINRNKINKFLNYAKG